MVIAGGFAPKIVSIDDDLDSLKSLEQLLKLKKLDVTSCLTPGDALRNLEEINPQAAIIDYSMPEMTGIECMEKILEKRPGLPVVILTGSRDVKTAVEALKAGAYHYLLKPIQPDELFSVMDKILGQLALKEENRRLKNELAEKYRFDSIIGKSSALENVFKLLSKAIKTKSTILITGESGTGKELFARAVHYNSSRKEGRFIKVNCAAIPESMLEAELFGIEKHVATGVDQRAGKFELSDGGSIFLDEIGDMSLATQAKVLRVLQEKEVERIGAASPRKVDMRVIAATNMDLNKAVEEKKFRQDLFFRLNVFHLHIPPLAERREDIPLLAEHFIAKYAEENGLPEMRLSSHALEHLMSREWPGNIRELENCIERAVAVADEEIIEIGDFGPPPESREKIGTSIMPPEQIDNLEEVVEEFERKIILKALEDNAWRQNRTAKKLGISERSIWHRIKKLGIDIKKSED